MKPQTNKKKRNICICCGNRVTDKDFTDNNMAREEFTRRKLCLHCQEKHLRNLYDW